MRPEVPVPAWTPAPSSIPELEMTSSWKKKLKRDVADGGFEAKDLDSDLEELCGVDVPPLGELLVAFLLPQLDALLLAASPELLGVEARVLVHRLEVGRGLLAATAMTGGHLVEVGGGVTCHGVEVLFEGDEDESNMMIGSSWCMRVFTVSLISC